MERTNWEVQLLLTYSLMLEWWMPQLCYTCAPQSAYSDAVVSAYICIQYSTHLGNVHIA